MLVETHTVAAQASDSVAFVPGHDAHHPQHRKVFPTAELFVDVLNLEFEPVKNIHGLKEGNPRCNPSRRDLCGVEVLSLGGSAQANFDRCPVGHNDAVLALRDLGQMLHVQDPRATLADVLIAAQEAAQGAEHDSVVLGRNALHFGALRHRPPPDETLMRHVPSHLEFWHLITRGPRARDLGSASWNLSK